MLLVTPGLCWWAGPPASAISFEDRVVSQKSYEACIDVLTARITVKSGTLLLPEDVG